MSDNWPLYAAKMRERRDSLRASASLRRHLEELLYVVRHCEEMWALEDRISAQK